MAIIINLIVVFVLFGFLYRYCFHAWAGLQRFFLSVITAINIYFLFSSISYFLSLNLSLLGLSTSNIEVLTLVILSFTLLGLIYLGEQRFHQQYSYDKSSVENFCGFFSFLSGDRTTLILKILTGLSAIVVLFYCASKFNADPHGEWDAWAIWNLKARFLYRASTEWTIGFSSVINWSHPDYPLFLPSLVAKFWNLIGNETVIISHLVAAFYLIASTYVMFCVIAKLSHSNIAYLAVLLLLSSYTYIRNSVFLTADIPLANLLLISVCFFSCYLIFKQFSMLILAFLFLSATVWVKNEGQLIFLVFGVCFYLQAWRVSGFKRASMIALISILPSLISFWIFKEHISLDNDLFAKNSFSVIFGRALDISRYQLVFSSFVETVVDIFKVNLIFVLALLIYFRRRILNFAGVYLLVAITLSVVGYLSIYIYITPHNLPWHLETSIERILLHFYPTFIFVLFLIPLKFDTQKA